MIDMILTAWERALKSSIFTQPKRVRVVYLRSGEVLMGAYTDDELLAMTGKVMVFG
jgi:hypothetical protein